MISDLFLYKKGSPNRGLVWDSIVENLNLIETPVFGLKDKRSVRDRWTLLKTKYKKKTREEEAASGIDVDDLTERESLIEELCDKEESFVDVDSVRKQKEKINAEDIRMKALERMGETKKRTTSREFDGDSKPKKTRRGTSELVEYLKQRSGTDSELRREELAIKKNEQEIQKQTASQAAAQQLEMMRMMQEQNKKMMESQALLLQQQQQMSMAFLATMQKFTEK